MKKENTGPIKTTYRSVDLQLSLFSHFTTFGYLWHYSGKPSLKTRADSTEGNERAECVQQGQLEASDKVQTDLPGT